MAAEKFPGRGVFDRNPPSPEEYLKALEEMWGDKKREENRRKMLLIFEAQLGTDGKSTMERLAKVLNGTTHATASGPYRVFAKGVAEKLGREGDVDTTAKEPWAVAISRWEEHADPETGHDLFTLRPNFIEALKRFPDTASLIGLQQFPPSPKKNEFQHETQQAANREEDRQEEQRTRELIERLRRDRQPQFRRDVLAAYDSKCAITGCEQVEILEAAHIKPFSDGGMDRPQNGILLRVDLHRLFDAKLLSFARSDNGRIAKMHFSVTNPVYRAFHGQEIRLPSNPELRPDFPSES
jgi:hypothetical protein